MARGRPASKETRVLGPYRSGNLFLIYVVDPDGTRTSRSFRREKEAKESVRALKIAIEKRKSITVQEAFERYEFYLRTQGRKRTTIDTAIYRLYSFFPTRNLPLLALSQKLCQRYYEELSQKVSVDTHRNTLSLVKTFFSYLKKQGLLKENFWEGLEGVGVRNRGKKQLRFSEARRFAQRAIFGAEKGKEGCVAVLLALILGLRSGEIVSLKVRDVDDGGRLLWIERGKTRNARRTIEVPPFLQRVLQDLSVGRSGEKFLFEKEGRGRHRDFVGYWCKKLCREAGVPVVCAHSLRGLHASLATISGVSAFAVANTLGHGSTDVTEAHYTIPGAKEESQRRGVLRILEGGK